MNQSINCLLLTFEQWLGIITVLAALVSAFATVWVVFLSNKIWEKQKVRERNMQLEANNHQKFLEAHTAAWSLLAYLTKVENSKNIILYRGTATTPEYFFIKENALAFINELSKIFYDEGHGLFLSSQAKDKLYHARGIIYGFLLRCKTEKNTNPEVLIENPKFVSSIEEQYGELKAFLKTSAFAENKTANESAGIVA